ncbi:MAG: PhnD/SsuA/transferrin family substrate-binding protein, partial [Gammaproteobacteria bacterium]
MLNRFDRSKNGERSGLQLVTRALCVAAAMAAAFVVAGSARAADCASPEALTFAMVPTEESVAELELYKPVTDRMAELTGKKIEFFLPTSYASVVEGMLGGFIHVAVLGPYSYVIANEKDAKIDVFATYAKRPGHMQEEGPGYRAAL